MTDAPLTYVQRPVKIEAMQLTAETFDAVVDWLISEDAQFVEDPLITTIWLFTPEGTMGARELDYIVKGVEGEFYPVKPTIFLKTYTRSYE